MYSVCNVMTGGGSFCAIKAQFENKDLIANLAKEFIADCIEPPKNVHSVQLDREVPWGMINEACEVFR
jgi:hypothetical protein